MIVLENSLRRTFWWN